MKRAAEALRSRSSSAGAAPTFDVLVEIKDRDRIVVHRDVAASVDALLRRESVLTEVRVDKDGKIQVELDYSDVEGPEALSSLSPPESPIARTGPMRVYPFGVNRKRLSQALKSLRLHAEVVDGLDNVDVMLTLRSYYRKRPAQLREAEELNVPVYVLRNNSVAQLETCLANVFEMHAAVPPSDPIAEAEAAARQVLETSETAELWPTNSFARRLQHQIAERYNLSSRSFGSGPGRRVHLSKRLPWRKRS